MDVCAPSSIEQSLFITEQMDDVRLFVVQALPEKFLKYDFWLGSSKSGSVWALFVTDNHSDTERSIELTAKALVTWLSDPPKRDLQTIGSILFDTYAALMKGEQISDETLGSIIRTHPFPEYRTVGEYLPSAPNYWRPLPAEIVVGFELSEGACLSSGIFDEYRRDSFERIISSVRAPRIPGILLSYALTTPGVVPLAPYEVDWPLAKRGKAPPYKRDSFVPGDLPWEREPNTTLVRIYQHASVCQASMAPHYFEQPVIRLCVAGANEQAAISNWTMIAPALRTI